MRTLDKSFGEITHVPFSLQNWHSFYHYLLVAVLLFQAATLLIPKWRHYFYPSSGWTLSFPLISLLLAHLALLQDLKILADLYRSTDSFVWSPDAHTIDIYKSARSLALYPIVSLLVAIAIVIYKRFEPFGSPKPPSAAG